MNIIKECKWCKKQFKSWEHQKRLFCSNKCRAIFNAQKNRKELKCINCNNEFIVVKSKNRKYCSRKCYLDFRRRNTKLIKCLICGKEIESPQSRERKYCSQKCLGKSLSLQYKGKNNPAYIDGMSKDRMLKRDGYRELRRYREWRRKVYKRDNYTCRECGRKRKKGDRVILNAHHIKSWRKYPKLRYKISNGITLCVECNKKVMRLYKGAKK